MIRIGVDFGGTKIEAAALDVHGRFQARVRAPNPGNYAAALETVRALIAEAEAQAGKAVSVGVGLPGSISPRTGRIRNANSTWLNGELFNQDLERTLGRPVRLANDANCLALSESIDGAGAGHEVVFAVIIGTGVGGGVAFGGRAFDGQNGVAGEWGHMPLPWPREEELPGVRCWCGRMNCMELYCSGTGFARDFEAVTGRRMKAKEIEDAAVAGEVDSTAAFDRYVDRLARGLAVICDVLDPSVIVLGGGMSNTRALYERLPRAVEPYVFSDVFETEILPAVHGDSSGVRGAAWLWPLEK